MRIRDYTISIRDSSAFPAVAGFHNSVIATAVRPVPVHITETLQTLRPPAGTVSQRRQLQKTLAQATLPRRDVELDIAIL